MCGIAGFVDGSRSHESATQLIARMCQIIRHRGPDDQGVWVGDGMALGMRRLAIIDVMGGQQPLFNEDQSVIIVFNGEIYNYRELRDELRKHGHLFSTESDTEVIVHAYEEYGDECVKCLRGMFAFALWDRKRHRLLAARDRFGKKPLNYYWDGQRLIFGSEIKSLLEAGVPRTINPLALDEYLVYRYVPTPNTLFKDIMKLPASHILIYEGGQIRTQRYWALPFTPTSQDDEVTAIERTHALLKDAVQVRLMSEVPLGAFLSGGIDSSIVVGLMSSMMSQPVKTFSIGFEEDDYNELPYARQIAKHFATDHHEFVVRPDLVSILPQLIWACDEPFADDSLLPTYYISKLAREHVTVVLTGDGGDEIFAGYLHYQYEHTLNRIPAFVRSFLAQSSKLLPDGLRGKKRLENMGLDAAMRWLQSTMLFPFYTRSSLYTSDFFTHICDHDPYQRLKHHFGYASHLDITACQQYVDVRAYLADDILVKVDKASMFNSLEARTPLLDQHLAEYVSSLPSTLRMRNGLLKYLLKKVARDLVPSQVLTRPKQGFSTPLQYWFSRDLTGYAHDLLTSSRAQQRGIFEPQFIQSVLQSLTTSKTSNASKAVWALLCLELWFQIYIDEPSLLAQCCYSERTVNVTLQEGNHP
jgi:asparagine synthase (glutamine-hydrolysing)